MSIELKIKEGISKAIKSKDEITKEILRVALGQIQLDAYSSNTTEEQKLNVIRKLIKSNETTIEAMHQKDIKDWSVEWQLNAPTLAFEVAALQLLLPQTLSEEETLARLTANCFDNIKTAKADGQAIGVAMKYFKAENIAVDTGLVKKAVESIRSK